MAEQRHRTTVEVKADVRDVSRLRRVIEGVFNPRTVEAHTRAVERNASATRKLQQQEERLGQSRQRDTRGRFTGGRAGGGGGAGGRDARGRFVAGAGGGGAGGGGGGGAFAAGVGGGIGGYIGARAAQASQMGGALGRGEGAVGAAAGGIPIVGPFVAGAIGEAEGLYQQFLQRQIAGTEAFGQTGVGITGGSGFLKQGRNLGMQSTAAIGQLSQISQQTGIQGRGLTEGPGGGLAGEALMMQRVLGINAGGVVGAAGTAGGNVSPGQGITMMQDAIAAGFESGFRATRINDFIQQVAQTVTQLRTEGIMVTPDSIQTLVRGVSELGPSFAGEAAGKAAQTMMQRMRGMLDQGGFAGAVAYQAAQQVLGPRAGLLDIEKWLEENPDAAREAITGLIKRAGGGSKGATAMLLGEAFQGLSARQRGEMAEGRGLSDEEQQRRGGAGAKFVGDRSRQFEQQAGDARFAAGLAFKREELGGRADIKGAVQKIQETELEIVETFVPTVMKFVSRAIDEFKRLIQVFEEGGLSAVLGDVFSGIAKSIGDALKKAFEGITDYIAEELIPLMMEAFEQLVKDIKEFFSFKTLSPEKKKQLEEFVLPPDYGLPPGKAIPNPTIPANPTGKSSALSPSEGAADKLAQASILIQGASDDIRNQGAPIDGSVRGGVGGGAAFS